MTYLALRTEVANRIHLDVTADATRINRRINLAKDAIVGAARWWFTLTRAQFQTVTDYTTGTIAITLASGTVTGTSTVWTSAMVGRFLQVSGNNDWYEITAFTSATSITVTPVMGQATATGKAYIIRQFFYSLASDVDVIYDLRQWRSPRKLQEVNTRTLDELRPDYTSTGPPRAYVTWPRTTSRLWQVQIFPWPDDIYNIEYRYFRTIPDLSADADVPEIPVKWHWVILEQAILYYVQELGDESAIARQRSVIEAAHQQMLANNRPTTDVISVLRGEVSAQTRWVPYPPAYQQPE